MANKIDIRNKKALRDYELMDKYIAGVNYVIKEREGIKRSIKITDRNAEDV